MGQHETARNEATLLKNGERERKKKEREREKDASLALTLSLPLTHSPLSHAAKPPNGTLWGAAPIRFRAAKPPMWGLGDGAPQENSARRARQGGVWGAESPGKLEMLP